VGALAWLALATGVLAAAAPAKDPPPRRIALLDIALEGDVDPAIGTQLTSRYSELIAKLPDVVVISPDDVRALLQNEANKQLAGCTEDSCLAEVAGALGADVVVTGRVGRIGDGFAVSLTAVDARKVRSLGRANETWRGDSIALLELAGPMVDRLFAGDGAELTGTLEVSGALAGSRILLDDQVRGTAPAGQMGDIAIGAHWLQVVAEGRQPFARAIIVKRGQLTSIEVQQPAAEATPFYASWWFWTAAAVAVIGTGGATAGVIYVLATQGGGRTGVNASINFDTVATGGR